MVPENANAKTEVDDLEMTGFAKKLTLKGLGWDADTLKEWVSENPKETEIATVKCLVSSMEREQSTLKADQSNVRFRGEFHGVNLVTGQTLSAVQAFFPGAAEGYLENVKAQNDGAVMTAMVITVKADKGSGGRMSATGYQFGMRVLVDRKKSAAVFAALDAKLPKPRALPKPAGNGAKK